MNSSQGWIIGQSLMIGLPQLKYPGCPKFPIALGLQADILRNSYLDLKRIELDSKALSKSDRSIQMDAVFQQ